MIRPRMLSGMGASVGIRHTGSGGVWSAGRRDFQHRIAAALARSEAAHERKMLQACRRQAVTLGREQIGARCWVFGSGRYLVPITTVGVPRNPWKPAAAGYRLEVAAV